MGGGWRRGSLAEAKASWPRLAAVIHLAFVLTFLPIISEFYGGLWVRGAGDTNLRRTPKAVNPALGLGRLRSHLGLGAARHGDNVCMHTQTLAQGQIHAGKNVKIYI